MKRTPLVRRTPLRSGDPALPKNGRSKAGNPIPLAVRRAVAERSGGVCEFCQRRPAVHQHHRKLRSQGGEHTLDNLIHLCVEDHAFAHHNPRSAQAVGLIVPRHRNPADVPVKPMQYPPSGLDEFTPELTWNPAGAR